MGFVEDETPWCGGHVSARVRCVRANNPSPMTYVGTNSWIVAEPGAKECVVIDPAPAGEQVQRILATCGEARALSFFCQSMVALFCSVSVSSRVMATNWSLL